MRLRLRLGSELALGLGLPERRMATKRLSRT